jgi:simple sugar transport system substrate-binding protein
MKRSEQMTDPAMLFDPFTGPINDQDGTTRVAPYQRLSLGELVSMDWFVEGNVASIPR